MRVLQVTPYYHPALKFGGPAIKVKTIAEWLARRGHEVTVLTSCLLDLERVLSRHTVHARVNGVSIIYCAAPLRYRSVGVHPDAFRFVRRSLGGFDLAHVYGYYHVLGPTVAMRAWSARVPYVLEPLGAFRPIGRSLVKKRLYHSIVGARMARRAQRMIATSPQERAEIESLGIDPTRIVLRRNGVDLDEFACLPARGALRREIGVGAHQRIALFLGRVCAKKGVDVLLEAFARHTPQHHLVIAGPIEEAAYEHRLRALAVSLAIAPRVHFVGPRYGRDKLALLGDADLLVLPSRNENFGNVVAEAVAANVPVVISEHCGIAPWIAGRAGMIVPANGDAVGLAMARLLGDERLLEATRRRCPEVARDLAWQEPLCALEEVYGKVVREREERRSA